jgi:hypothetical protein
MSLIDIMQAEATVASDKTRIMADIESGIGVENLNRAVRGAIAGGALCDKTIVQWWLLQWLLVG